MKIFMCVDIQPIGRSMCVMGRLWFMSYMSGFGLGEMKCVLFYPSDQNCERENLSYLPRRASMI